jgi:hypothetical protein
VKYRRQPKKQKVNTQRPWPRERNVPYLALDPWTDPYPRKKAEKRKSLTAKSEKKWFSKWHSKLWRFYRPSIIAFSTREKGRHFPEGIHFLPVEWNEGRGFVLFWKKKTKKPKNFQRGQMRAFHRFRARSCFSVDP